MRRSVFFALAFAAAGSFAMADASASATNLQAPLAFQVAAGSKATVAARTAAAPASKTVETATGIIVKIMFTGSAKTAGAVKVLVGKKFVIFNVKPATIVKNAKGGAISLAKLKKGEKVRVEFQVAGNKDMASLISVLG
jgi:hypothetical protein